MTREPMAIGGLPFEIGVLHCLGIGGIGHQMALAAR